MGMAFTDDVLVFVTFFGLVGGVGFTIAAVRPRNRGAAFFVDTLFAAVFLTIAFACAWAVAGRLAWR